MIQNEVIELKQYTKGTKIVNFFGIDHEDLKDFQIGYLVTDLAGTPLKVTESLFDASYVRLPDNTFRYDGTIKFITGRTSVETLNYELSEERKGIIRQKFITNNKSQYGEGNVFWMEFSNVSVNDMYANVSFIKTYSNLNTLSVVNSIEGEEVLRESPTGVVFGKIEALQKINDEFGNKIKIPLANVPIGIFNVTEEFPDVSAVDDNGNRIVLNLKENSSRNQYFNDESYEFAQEFLTTTETLKVIPEKYRYSAMTNEKGEFVIYDVPVGSQTFMVEVDLLKQGLTKDEVSLNFFPYPTTSDPNVDSVPHLYFKQFAINVVPSWSDFQSGYTQLNISIPLDLRKWATYVFPPVGFGVNEKLEVTIAKNANRKFKVQVRDMTAKAADGTLYPSKTLTLAKIDADLDRDEGSQYIWFNEFAENRRQVEYTEFGCYVLKLPANLYDPDGFRTDENGVPTNNKGVWLAAYQLKEFIEEVIASRATGAYSYWGANKFQLISHFDLNNSFGNDIPMTYPVGENAIKEQAKYGEFPYEKPWSLTYPDKYKIPPKPVIERFVTANDGVKRQKYDATHYYMEEPAYEDGDLLGLEVNGLAGGFGIQYIPDPAGDGPGVFFPNRISQVATKNFMYKYERGVAWNETYANGYEPYWETATPDNPFAGYSKVKNGEKFQRVECGYGYFMKPQGWPRYVRASWGADIPTQDIQIGSAAITSPRMINKGLIGEMYSTKKWFADVYNIEKQNLTLAISSQSIIKRGGIDIYRIVKAGINNVVKPENFVIPTYARLTCLRGDLAYSFSFRNDGEIPVKIKNRFGRGVFYTDVNGNVQFAAVNQIIDFIPGAIMFLNNAADGGNYNGDAVGALHCITLNLPGNKNYSTDLNQYTSAAYTLGVTYSNTNAGSPGRLSFNFDTAASTDMPQWWVRTETSGGDAGIVHNGISRCFNYDGKTYDGKNNNVTRMFYEQYSDDLNEYGGYYV